jgi:hypothetical protein
MSVGVMKDYKRRDLHASHTGLGAPFSDFFLFSSFLVRHRAQTQLTHQGD